jgi:hypothetical protein
MPGPTDVPALSALDASPTAGGAELHTVCCGLEHLAHG